MRKMLVLGGVLGWLCGCGDSEITPDPTGSSGTDATSSSASTGAGGDGQGGDGQGGDGAGGGTMPGGGYESGTRLKVRTFVGDDGSRQPAGWFDSQINEECSFRSDAVGSKRCLPLAHRATYYADASCNTPLVWFSCGGPTSAYAEVSTGGCNDSVNIHQLGSATTPPPDIYIRLSNGSCQPGGIAPQGQWYAVGALVQPSTFVQASVEIEQ